MRWALSCLIGGIFFAVVMLVGWSLGVEPSTPEVVVVVLATILGNATGDALRERPRR